MRVCVCDGGEREKERGREQREKEQRKRRTAKIKRVGFPLPSSIHGSPFFFRFASLLFPWMCLGSPCGWSFFPLSCRVHPFHGCLLVLAALSASSTTAHQKTTLKAMVSGLHLGHQLHALHSCSLKPSIKANVQTGKQNIEQAIRVAWVRKESMTCQINKAYRKPMAQWHERAGVDRSVPRKNRV